MNTRQTLRRRLLLLCFLALAVPATAQVTPDRMEPGLTIGGFVGGGSGPTPTAVAGLDVLWPGGRTIATRLTLDWWDAGVGTACAQQWPDSYRCSVGGFGARFGLRAQRRLWGPVAAIAELGAGMHRREDLADDVVWSSAYDGGLGATVRLGARWAARIAVRHMRAADERYETLMGEALRWTAFVVGVEWAPAP